MRMPRRVPLPETLKLRPFTVVEGRDAGLTRKRMTGNDLDRPFHGVRIASQAPLSLLELCSAYQQRAPAHAFFSGPTAAVILAMPVPPRLSAPLPLHIAVPAPHRAPSGKRIIGHALTISAESIIEVGGLRLSSPARTWCDLGSLLELADLVAAGDHLIHWRSPLLSKQELERAVADYPGRRGRPRLGQALDLLSDRAESPQESRLRVLLLLGGIDGLAVNHPVITSGGYRYRMDLAIPERKVAIEYQGDYHREVDQYRRDMTRVSRLEADGWYVVLVNANDLHDPAELLSRLRQVLSRRK